MKEKEKLPRTDEEMKKRYIEAFDYDPSNEEVKSHYDDEFNAWIESDEL